jgi:CDP-diacylglycerol--glycerol-3-phosphate 3-phosphatidyltransferase
VRSELLHVNMHNFGMFFFVIALALTLWSGFDYLYKFFRVFARS